MEADVMGEYNYASPSAVAMARAFFGSLLCTIFNCFTPALTFIAPSAQVIWQIAKQL
jgi:hypothetical protein